MISTGLTDAEQAQLEEAGFHPRLVKAVADEAATMRLLFMRRLSGGGWASGLAIIGGVSVGAFQILGDAFGWIATLLVPLLGGVLAMAPWLEVRLLRRHEPVRWAARRLALLAVSATTQNNAAEEQTGDAEAGADSDPDNGEADKESLWTRLFQDDEDQDDDDGDHRSTLLQHAATLSRFDSPRSALRYLAREMIREETGTDPHNPAPNRTLTVDQSQLSDTVWRAAAALAALTLIALLAVQAFMS